MQKAKDSAAYIKQTNKILPPLALMQTIVRYGTNMQRGHMSSCGISCQIFYCLEARLKFPAQVFWRKKNLVT